MGDAGGFAALDLSPDDLVLRAKGIVFGLDFWIFGKGFGFVFIVVHSSTSILGIGCAVAGFVICQTGFGGLDLSRRGLLCFLGEAVEQYEFIIPPVEVEDAVDVR